MTLLDVESAFGHQSHVVPPHFTLHTWSLCPRTTQHKHSEVYMERTESKGVAKWEVYPLAGAQETRVHSWL